MLLEKPKTKLQKFIVYSYGIQIIHILVCWNPHETKLVIVTCIRYVGLSVRLPACLDHLARPPVSSIRPPRPPDKEISSIFKYI
jgi:hypothetical protein